MMRKLLKLFALFLLINYTDVLAQDVVIKGSVVNDLDKEPLIGASVGIKGTTKGTVTDANGNYTLTIPTKEVSKTILIARYIGFIASEISVGDKTVINFSLTEDAMQLKEVVAIGYATVSRKDLTGAVSSINAKQLKDIPLSSAAEAITGKLAGVQVTTSEGAPGADVLIKIRGGGSITQDNSPLYIIDGVQIEDGLNSISPQDIESIDVLKDASSTSIYGARGANGVIIITTKGGKDMKAQVNYSNILGFKSLANKLDVMNPYEFVVRQYEKSRGLTTTESGFETRYGTWADIDQYKETPFIDWQEKTFGNDAFMQTHNLSITGGNKTSQYNLSLTSNNEDGIMLNSSYKRKLAYFKFDTHVSDALRAGFNVRFSDEVIGGAGTSNDGNSSLNTLRHTIKYRPLEAGGLNLDEQDEEYYSETNTGNAIGIINPVQLSNALYRSQPSRRINLSGYLDYKFDKHFSFRTTLGVDYRNLKREDFQDAITSRARVVGGNLPLVGVLEREFNTLLNSNVLSYNYTKSKKHRLDILLGNEFYNMTANSDDIQLRYFPKDISAEKALNQLNLGTIFPGYPITNKTETRTVSFFGRANYSLNQKYLASFSLRADASSRFSADNRWGYFPSGALAWRISEEDFMKNVPVISDLKLRVSYGSSGNDRIQDYSYQNIYTASAMYALNEQIIPGHAATDLANKNLIWETTISKNIGLDISLWKDRVQLVIDAYKNKVNNLLIDVPIPSTTGYTRQLQNVGNTSNKGLEFQLNAVTIRNKNFSWTNSFNISFNRNKIEKLANQQSFYFEDSGFGISGQPADYIVKVGAPVGTMYGYVNDGFYTTNDFDYDAATSIYTLKAGVTDVSGVIGTPQPGWMKLKDLDGNHVIDENDKKIIGNANPKFIGGLNQQFVYKNFDMSVFVNFVVGNDVYNANKIEFTNGYSSYTNSLAILNGRWKTIDENGNLIQQLVTINGEQVATGAAPEVLNAINKDASMWIPISGVGAWFPTSWAMEDASFLRINNITFGYTFPTKTLKHIGVNKLRVYGTVNNLAVITNYSGYDPEVNTRRSVPVTPGVDYSAYPRNKTFIFGLNLSL